MSIQPAVQAMFYRQLLRFSAVVAIVTLAASILLPKQIISPSLPFLILFFVFASTASFHLVFRKANERTAQFINAFLLSTALKLLVFLVVMVVYALVNRKDAIPFLVSFFLFYLAYTVFDTLFIVRNSKPSR